MSLYSLKAFCKWSVGDTDLKPVRLQLVKREIFENECVINVFLQHKLD